MMKFTDDIFDYSDVPGDSGLSEAYVDSLRSDGVRAAIAKRKAELARRAEVAKAPEAKPA